MPPRRRSTSKYAAAEPRGAQVVLDPGDGGDVGGVAGQNPPRCAGRWQGRGSAWQGLAGKAELLTGIEGVSSRPVRRIVLMGGR